MRGEIETIFVTRFFPYIKEHGTKLQDKKCLANWEQLCDIECPKAIIRFGIKGFLVGCGKFEPPIYMGERQFEELEEIHLKKVEIPEGYELKMGTLVLKGSE